jgi:hypothetical protein
MNKTYRYSIIKPQDAQFICSVKHVIWGAQSKAKKETATIGDRCIMQ